MVFFQAEEGGGGSSQQTRMALIVRSRGRGMNQVKSTQDKNQIRP